MNLEDFIARYDLPCEFSTTAEEFYVPLACWLDMRVAKRGSEVFVLGISGAQGTGKSTLSQFLSDYLQSEYGRKVADLSIDDLYLRRSERESLAKLVHPLLVTRGVPGTHDVELGLRVLDGLARLRRGQRLAVPRFDKATDDRRPVDEWPVFRGPIELMIVEGWCVGSERANPRDLVEPINDLEAQEDRGAVWRRYVNTQLESVYPMLFARVDALVFLNAPSFDAIYRWRLAQERNLSKSVGAKATQLMNEGSIARFIQHYERITRRDLKQMPPRADVVLELGHDHAVESVRYMTGPLDRDAGAF